MEAHPLLSMQCICKSFGKVQVLNNVSLEAFGGEILGILGQNGAGKSTLIKILSGFYPQGTYSGVITVDGEEMLFSNTRSAEKRGIIMIPQEIEIFSNLTVAETLYLSDLGMGQNLIDWNALYAMADKDLKRYGIDDINPRTPMGVLTRAQHQLLLIIKSLIQSERDEGTKILILDEPTASLTDSETLVLFEHLEKIKNMGIACLYISHRLGEVFKICDRFYIMRDGNYIGTYKKAESSIEEVVFAMVGRKVDISRKNQGGTIGENLLEVSNLSIYDLNVKNRRIVNDVSFNVREGEILGVFGLMGAGKTETAMGIYGSWLGRVEGEICIRGKKAEICTVKDALSYRIGFLPEDRRLAVFDLRPIRENIVLGILNRLKNKFGLIERQKEIKSAFNLIRELSIKVHSIEDNPSTLSGGNKQKVLVSRLLGADSEILIVDEPSIGVDINTRIDIYEILRRMARESRCAVLVFSSDVEEILQVSDRILVLKNGTIADIFENNVICEGAVDTDMILKAATA